MNLQFSSRLARARSLLAGGVLLRSQRRARRLAAEACPQTDTGITVPPGFCATVFADNIGHARQMVVAPDGTVYVNTWSGVYYNNDTPPAGGFLVALQGHQGQPARRTRSRASAQTAAEGGARRHRHRALQGWRSTRRSTTASCAMR